MVRNEDTEEALDKVIQQLETLAVQTSRLVQAVEDLNNGQQERRPTSNGRQSSTTTNDDTHSTHTLRVDRVFVRIRGVPFSSRQGVVHRFAAQRVVVRLDNGSDVYRSPRNIYRIQE